MGTAELVLDGARPPAVLWAPERASGSSVCVRHPFSAKPLPDLQAQLPHLPAPLPTDATPGPSAGYAAEVKLGLVFGPVTALFLGLKAGC